MTEAYPAIDVPSQPSSISESPQTVTPTPPEDAISIIYLDKKATVDISAALTVDDVKTTLLTIFNLGPSARVVVKRSRDGAVVVPGPKLPPGEYILEEVHGPLKLAYNTLRDKHVPYAAQQLQERHIPFLVSSTKTGAQKVKGALLVAKDRGGEGLSVVKTHVSKGLTVAGENVGKGLATAGTHVGGAVTTAGTYVRGHVVRATSIANRHATTNSDTWTAKLWTGLVKCAPGPMAWITGVPVDQLVPPEPLPVDGSPSESVPLSKPAEVNAAA